MRSDKNWEETDVPHFSIVTKDRGDPITFDVSGLTLHGDKWTETFTSLPALPIGLLADLGDGVFPAKIAAEFIHGLLEPGYEETDAEGKTFWVAGSDERFARLIRDKNRLVVDADLAAILQQLFAALTGRPTQPSSGSPTGSDGVGTTSMGASPSPELMSVGSTRNGS